MRQQCAGLTDPRRDAGMCGGDMFRRRDSCEGYTEARCNGDGRFYVQRTCRCVRTCCFSFKTHPPIDLS
jgi:hypothetical protein